MAAVQIFRHCNKGTINTFDMCREVLWKVKKHKNMPTETPLIHRGGIAAVNK